MKNKKYSITGNAVVFIFAFIMFLSMSTFFNCSGKSDEDSILETIGKIGDSVENRNAEGILFYVSDNYTDEENRTVDDIEELLGEYLSRYRGIAVNVLGTRILTLTAPDAVVEVDVALSSGAAQIFRKAVRIAGEFYRFNLELVKEDETWKCKRASWKYITVEELFPESAKVLKELFPNAF